MTDSYQAFIKGNSLPKMNQFWPLNGAGLENFGKDHNPKTEFLPDYGPNDLLIRHDACSLCYSDVKVIRQGQSHPRIHKNMKTHPVVLGHEVCFTVVGVGENIQSDYRIGERFTLQPDIYIDGIGQSYGYAFQGGLSQYSIIPPEIRHTDNGNMLIPLPENIGYAEASLMEPWACVLAAYHLNYRDHIKPGGCLWIISDGNHGDSRFDFSKVIQTNTPAVIFFSNTSQDLKSDLIELQKTYKFHLVSIKDSKEISDESVDDIVLLAPSAQAVETFSRKLTNHGIMALCTDRPLDRGPQIDLGRIHYQRWLYIAGSSHDIAEIYMQTPVRAALKPGGKAWFAGSGGPIGRMHVQHAIYSENPPSHILCTDINQKRLDALETAFRQEAEDLGIVLTCLNPNQKQIYERAMEQIQSKGFDDIVILAPVPSMVSEASSYLANNGVMNIFAGIRRGETVALTFDHLIKKQARIIGHSGSKLEDMHSVLDQWHQGTISTNRAVAAIGSLEAAKEGYQALIEGRFPGKVVIYPNIQPFPLTGLPDLKEQLPSSYDKLSPEGHWTNQAEAEFLKLMLP